MRSRRSNTSFALRTFHYPYRNIGHRPPCNLDPVASVRVTGAVADGRPVPLRVMKPVGEQGSPSAVPSNPNSREGRKRSPIAQGGVKMEATIVGIDVSK